MVENKLQTAHDLLLKSTIGLYMFQLFTVFVLLPIVVDGGLLGGYPPSAGVLANGPSWEILTTMIF